MFPCFLEIPSVSPTVVALIDKEKFTSSDLSFLASFALLDEIKFSDKDVFPDGVPELKNRNFKYVGNLGELVQLALKQSFATESNCPVPKKPELILEVVNDLEYVPENPEIVAKRKEAEENGKVFVCETEKKTVKHQILKKTQTFQEKTEYSDQLEFERIIGSEISVTRKNKSSGNSLLSNTKVALDDDDTKVQSHPRAGKSVGRQHTELEKQILLLVRYYKLKIRTVDEIQNNAFQPTDASECLADYLPLKQKLASAQLTDMASGSGVAITKKPSKMRQEQDVIVKSGPE